MKHLYLLVLIVWTNSYLSTAQISLPINNCSSPGACDGSATFNNSANFSTSTWVWYEDDTSTIIASGGQQISNLCAGHYFLEVDSTGYSQLVSFTIIDTCSSMNMTMSTASVTDCTPGNCDGEIYIYAYLGTSPYTYYLESVLAPSPIISNLCPGTYNFSCIDAMGCTATLAVTLSDTSLSVISPNFTVVDSSANCTGSASLAPTGGSGSYTYLWSTGETTSFVYMLCVGNYWVTIYDGTDSVTFNFEIHDACTFGVIVSQTPASAPGVCDGSATATVFGTGAPFTFNWNNGANTQSISNLCSGFYTVTCTNVYGCMTSEVVVVNATPPPFSVNLTTTGDLTGNCIGEAQVAPTGSSGPYSYLWSTGETTSTIGNLCVGNYHVTVWDNADTITTNFTITNPCANFTGSFTTTGTINGNCTGTITVAVSGGLPGYQYSLDNGVTFSPLATFNSLCPGTYDFIGMDANGCIIDQPITISDSIILINLLANLTSTDDLTNNCSGSASVSPGGGIAPYTIAWSNGSNGASVSNLCAGIYSVTIWDAGTDSTTVNFVITDSASTYSNNSYPNGTISDTLYTDLVMNCVIDYNTVDSAALYQAVYSSSSQSLYVTWAIYSPTDTVYINDTLAFTGNPGYYNLMIAIYCPNKSGNDFFKIESVIYFDGSTVWMSTLNVTENALNNISIYPNPFTHSISVDNKDGVIKSMKLVDLNGRVLSEMPSVNSGMVKLDQLDAISSGTYLLILSGENSSGTYKVIK
ncbi:T9SS type A sorting domain-containing protein [Fluviicola taffensis]|uniref:Secretion system C-terminal sorting domain-containing protein n=1 Tax=Fluviicola taffensis (strain DSM 16823 / NCIMB 13979 / RW262) TaxID=755732 RepID=F2IFV2_FLUTR|nr:T9SS type A sorting domain-containing protein [Fluviicola taffensis]AEA43573.1 hypothetical protein Fluta_1581 [Fluviicola taffensis DSM 16823]